MKKKNLEFFSIFSIFSIFFFGFLHFRRCASTHHLFDLRLFWHPLARTLVIEIGLFWSQSVPKEELNQF